MNDNKKDYMSALATLQEAFYKYENAVNQFNQAEKLNAILAKNVLSNEKHLDQLDMMNAILEQKFVLVDPTKTRFKMKIRNPRRKKGNFKKWPTNGKNFKMTYNNYPLKWESPPKPWFSYKAKYKEEMPLFHI